MKGKFDFKQSLIMFISIMFIGFQLYLALIRPLHPLLQNPVHLLFALSLVFLYKPLGKGLLRGVDIAIEMGILYILYYFVTETNRIQYRIPFVDMATNQDIVVMLLSVIILLEAVRRVLGLNLLIFILIFIAYATWGKYFPGWLKFDGINLPQFTELMIMGSDGIFGLPLSTSSGYLFYFILFGAFFSAGGGGQLLIDMGMKLSNKEASGPAKAAVISSGLMGMVSGSAVANVSTTGVMTIPMMKKVGYQPEQAGAIEAIASTGGQIMPPIMGAGAFIMAEMLGINYGKVAMAAIIPAVAYYASILMLVHFLAKKRKHKIEDVEVEFESKPIMKRLYLLIPTFMVVYNILAGASLMKSALIGTAMVIVLNFFNKEDGLNFKGILDCFLAGARQAADIAVPTAACGIIIGVAVQSGMTSKLSGIMAGVGGGNLLVALLMTMAGCMILGMALPTVAAYLVSVILFVPTLTKLGIPALPANMFVFYFGIIAQITPPVCLASFTAAGIAGANSWKTGWTAFLYAFVAFLIPFVFVYQPAILLMGSVQEIVLVCITLGIGTYFLASAIAGYLFIPLESILYRGILLVIAIAVIAPEMTTSIIGVAGGIAFAGYCYTKGKKEKFIVQGE